MKALTTPIKPCGWPSQFFSPEQSPTGDNRQTAKEGNSVSVKASARSKIKPIKVICDRCKQIAEGIRGEQFTSGFYDMTKWEEYRRENEQHVCHSCMFADPKYLERYGSCF
jgi:hypothetical protein